MALQKFNNILGASLRRNRITDENNSKSCGLGRPQTSRTDRSNPRENKEKDKIRRLDSDFSVGSEQESWSLMI
jgi:hypothetical protein